MLADGFLEFPLVLQILIRVESGCLLTWTGKFVQVILGACFDV